MSKEYLVITIIGPDRRGLVAKITDVILAQNANIEESKMSRLGGEFAVLMLLSVSEGSKGELLAGLEKLNGQDVHIFFKETNLARIKVFEGFIPYEISVIGADHEGGIWAVDEDGSPVKVGERSYRNVTAPTGEERTLLMHRDVSPGAKWTTDLGGKIYQEDDGQWTQVGWVSWRAIEIPDGGSVAILMTKGMAKGSKWSGRHGGKLYQDE